MLSDTMSGGVAYYPRAPVMEYFPHSRAHCTTYSPSPEPPQTRPPMPQQRSRKRSRNEVEDEDRLTALHEENVMDTSAPAPEPIYGEGMNLVDPVTLRPIGHDASSSTGTWHEAQLEEDRLAAAVAAEQAIIDQDEMVRASNRPSKASRLDLSGCRSSELRTGSPSTTPGLVAPTPLTPDTPSAPTYDQAAMTLGIGWRMIDTSDASYAAASKGWAKYIDNHFAYVRASEVLAKSESKGAFLVKAIDVATGSEGWYLFNEALTDGQLLSNNIQSAIYNVQTGQFEGAHMVARISPEPVAHDVLPNGSLPAEMAMDM